MKARKGIYLFAVCLFFSTFIPAYASTDTIPPEVDKTIEHLSLSVNYENKAIAIINKGSSHSIMSIEDSEKMIEYFKKALEEANQVDTEILNLLYPSWGDRYKNEYINGLKLIIMGNETSNIEFSIEGQEKTISSNNT